MSPTIFQNRFSSIIRLFALALEKIDKSLNPPYLLTIFETLSKIRPVISLQIKIISALSLIPFIQFTDNKRGTTCKKGYSFLGSTSSALLPTRNSNRHEPYSRQ
jgi:hypothetical protein